MKGDKMDNKLLILNALKAGITNSTPRSYLCDITGLSDRKIRDLIADLINDGSPILSNTSNGGYYYPDTIEECDRNISMLDNYIRSLAIRKNNILKWKRSNPHKHEQLGLNL